MNSVTPTYPEFGVMEADPPIGGGEVEKMILFSFLPI
jgi:hypothetical protein